MKLTDNLNLKKKTKLVVSLVPEKLKTPRK